MSRIPPDSQSVLAYPHYDFSKATCLRLPNHFCCPQSCHELLVKLKCWVVGDVGNSQPHSQAGFVPRPFIQHLYYVILKAICAGVGLGLGLRLFLHPSFSFWFTLTIAYADREEQVCVMSFT